MPIEIDKGPGGVDAAYGKRTTLPTRSYDVTKVYGDTFREDGDGPVNQIMKETDTGYVGLGTDTPVGTFNLAGTSADPAEIVLTRTDGTIGERNWYERVNSSHNFEIGRMDDLGGNPSPKVTVDKAGNVGVSVTPSVWGSGKAIEIGQQGFGMWNNSSNDIRILAGARFAAGSWLYSITGVPVTRYDQQTGQYLWFSAPAGTAGGTISWTQSMNLDASGNLGLGVTPSVSNNRTMEIGAVGNALIAGGTNDFQMVSGAYYNTGYKYAYSQAAAQYKSAAGQHVWSIAPAGTAGNAITWTQAMTLDTSSNLGVSVVPSAWASSYKAIEIIPGGGLWGNSNGNSLMLSCNTYYDGAYKYKGAFPAAMYQQPAGTHKWYVAGTGTADATITWTQAVTIDNSGNLLVIGSGGLGYGTGSGGTVTQLTSKSTTVVLNKPTGKITMNNAALAAGASVAFQLTNSTISANDTLSLSFDNGATWAGINSYSYRSSVSNGAAIIALKNESAGSLSEAVVLNFAVIKGATS